jgi:hypothetical protein
MRLDGTMVIAHRPAAWVLALALCACDEPIVIEVSALACANGLDDDGDDALDCDDPDCALSGACEITPEACLDGEDQDEDGRTDCEDAQCLAIAGDEAPCRTTRTTCDHFTSDGCVRGQRCVAFPEGTEIVTECRPPGELTEDASCDLDTDACGPGLVCALGFCTPPCRVDGDCDAGERCLQFAPDRGYCSTACTPFDAGERCEGGTCASLSIYAFSFAEGGALFTCLPDELAAPFLGTATEGAPCARRASPGTPASMRCAEGLACVPAADGAHTCRRGCTAALGSGGYGCERSCERCVPSYPFEAEENGDFAAGTCECDVGCGVCE